MLDSLLIEDFFCHNPNNNTMQPQYNLNTVVGLDMKMIVHTQPTTEIQR